MVAAQGVLLPFRRSLGTPRVRLICLPFAGGAATIFREWSSLLPKNVDVCAVELPGHGTRSMELPVGEADRLVDGLHATLETLAGARDVPTILFGHSLGAHIAFALAHRPVRADALIVSGARAPHHPARRSYADLPRAELVRELRTMGGTPPAILEHEEMLDILLPMLRADFRVAETLVARAGEPVACPITALAATDDAEVPLQAAEAWKIRTTNRFRFVTMEGGHFFLVSRPEQVIAEVKRVVAEVTGAS